MQNKTDVKKLLKELITRDPYIAGYLLNVGDLGVEEFTYGRRYIITYISPKKDIFLILDPWTEMITVRDEAQGTTQQIHIKKITKALKELYGEPELRGIPKFGTNIPSKSVP
jgi:hypothetical protein